MMGWVGERTGMGVMCACRKDAVRVTSTVV